MTNLITMRQHIRQTTTNTRAATAYFDYKRTYKKLKKQETHLEFLIQCRNADIIPKFLKIRTHIKIKQEEKIIQSAEKKRLLLHLKIKRSEINTLQNKCNNYINTLKSNYTILEDFENTIKEIYHETKKRIVLKFQNRQYKKFLALKKQQQGEKQKTQFSRIKANEIFFDNRSKQKLNGTQIKALNRGAKFAYPEQIQKFERIIPPMENIIKNLQPKTQEATRFKMCRILKNSAQYSQRKERESTILKNEEKELKKLRDNNEISIIEADKNNQLVILDRSVYEEKMKEEIKNLNTKIVKTDPNEKLTRKIALIKNHSLLPEKIKKAAYIPNGAHTPLIFGKLKTHKPEENLRLIVAKSTSPLINLERKLAETLKPLFENHKYTLKSTTQLIDFLKEFNGTSKKTDSYILYSLDVVALYPNTPVTEAIKEIENKIIESTKYQKTETQAIIELLEYINNNNFFKFNQKIYKQLEGAPMGSPLSGIFAEAIMQIIEKENLDNSKENQPLFYFRYVDDIIIAWTNTEEEFFKFRDKLESKYQSIKFTVEKEEKKSIPFLDLKLIKSNNKIDYKVYRKPTNDNIIIPADSNHPKQMKMNTLKNMILRANTHSSKKIYYDQELEYIRKLATENKYKISELNNLIRNTERENKEKYKNSSIKKPTKFVGNLPYIPAITNTLKKICRNQNMDFGTTITTNLTSIKTSKDKIGIMDKAGVYQIPIICEKSTKNNSNMSYIGSTKINLKTRIKQHKTNWLKKENHSALISYCQNNSCTPDFTNVKLLAQHKHLQDVRYSEALHIEKLRNHICNIHDAQHIPYPWRHAMEHQKLSETKNKKQKYKNTQNKKCAKNPIDGATIDINTSVCLTTNIALATRQHSQPHVKLSGEMREVPRYNLRPRR